MNLENLHSKTGAAERMLKAPASRPRLMIVCESLDGEHTVTALRQAVGLSMSAMSQHLARLRADGLASTRRESQAIHYSLSSEPARPDRHATRTLSFPVDATQPRATQPKRSS